jgi:hypothetical protein
VWSEHWATVGDRERSVYPLGVSYAQHMSSMFQDVTATGAYQRLRLEEYNH